MWRHRAQLSRRVGRIALAAAIVLGVAWLVFWPYLETRATWAVLATRTSVSMARDALGGTGRATNSLQGAPDRPLPG